MDLGALVGPLSSVVAAPETQRAAERLLALSNPSAALTAAYGFLIQQRTLRQLLAHLEGAGGDLDAIEIPLDVFRTDSSPNRRGIWNVEREPPITARTLVDVAAHHRSLLAEPVRHLVAAGIECFCLVSGRAYEARYPDYRFRMEFDTDMIVPDFEAAASVTRTLVEAGYPLDTVRIDRIGASADGNVEIRRRVDGHLVSIGVLVGGYHAHRGPIFERAGHVELGGTSVRAACPEDLLVMLAARAERKRGFALVSFNDATVILGADGARMDWDVVCDAARNARLEAALVAVLDGAERVLGRPAVPVEARRSLERSAGQTGLGLARRVAADTTTFRTRRDAGADRITRRIWGGLVAARQQRRPERQSTSGRYLLALQRRILAAQLTGSERSRRPPGLGDRVARLVRTRCGTLCELAPDAAPDTRCLGARAGWAGPPPATARLRRIAESFAPLQAEHDCRRLSFGLAASPRDVGRR